MKPIEFKGQSLVLQKPPGMTDEECQPLAILRLEGTCISCWRMTWRERLKALRTGCIWLGVLSGHTQPPVYLAVDQPFKVVRNPVTHAQGRGDLDDLPPQVGRRAL